MSLIVQWLRVAFPDLFSRMNEFIFFTEARAVEKMKEWRKYRRKCRKEKERTGKKRKGCHTTNCQLCGCSFWSHDLTCKDLFLPKWHPCPFNKKRDYFALDGHRKSDRKLLSFLLFLNDVVRPRCDLFLIIFLSHLFLFHRHSKLISSVGFSYTFASNDTRRKWYLLRLPYHSQPKTQQTYSLAIQRSASSSTTRYEWLSSNHTHFVILYTLLSFISSFFPSWYSIHQRSLSLSLSLLSFLSRWWTFTPTDHFPYSAAVFSGAHLLPSNLVYPLLACCSLDSHIFLYFVLFPRSDTEQPNARSSTSVSNTKWSISMRSQQSTRNRTQ